METTNQGIHHARLCCKNCGRIVNRYRMPRNNQTVYCSECMKLFNVWKAAIKRKVSTFENTSLTRGKVGVL